jgi:hypothetical protein
LFEDERWGQSAFIGSFPDALRSHADRDHDELLSVGAILPQEGRRRVAR